MRADDLVFVGFAGWQIGDEDFPDAARPRRLRIVRRRPSQSLNSPTTGDAFGVGRPDGEVEAGCALMVHEMRTELVEEPQMRAFSDVVVVHRTENGAEGIRVGHPPLAAWVAQGDIGAAGVR